MRKLSALSLVLVLSFTSTLYAQEYYKKYKGDSRRGEPTAEAALVYIFRPASVGAGVKTWAFADEQLLMVSKKTAYSFALVPPGKHMFWSKAENTSSLEMEVSAGETYYFKQSIRMGFNKARVKIEPMDAQEAEKYLKKCSYVEPTEAGEARAAEIAANRLTRAKENLEKEK